MSSQIFTKSLFGNPSPWSPADWISSDDRVRGGSSQSYLTISPGGSSATFHGNLDIKTLGGAGFASQRTTGEERAWDLSPYIGILLDIESADEKRYTFTLKDELLPQSPNGREQSTISWEYDFCANKDGEKILIRWEDFQPTFRGKEKKDAKPLNLGNIKRISIMMRSFFGSQEGDFSLNMRSISAAEKHEQYRDDPGNISLASEISDPKDRLSNGQPKGWVERMFGACVVS